MYNLEQTKNMKKVTLIKVFAVMVVNGDSMTEVFRSTDKNACKEFKRQNKELGKLGIMWVENIFA